MASYGSISDAKVAVNGAADGEAEPLIKKQINETAAVAKDSKRSLWSQLIFGWFGSLLVQGNAKKKLDPEDLDLIPFPNEYKTNCVTDVFNKYWTEELKGTKPSLYRALFFAFGADFMKAGLLKLVHDLCVFVGPQVLHAIIVFLRDPNAPTWNGLALTLVVTCSQLTMSLCLRHYFFKCYTTGLRLRTAIVVAVYRKALVLSSGERQTRTLGEITNLVSIDAQRLQDLTTYVHAIWYAPVQIGLALYFLWGQMGVSSLGGVAVIILMMPVTKSVAGLLGKKAKKLMKAKDERVDVNTEVLSSMRVIKYQAWEEAFEERIMSKRDAELGELLRYMVWMAFTRIFWTITPLAVALATFAAFVWSGHILDVASALTALALFDILRFPLFMLPNMINNLVEATVAINRIRSFLLCKEHESVGGNGLDELGIQMSNVSAAYDSKKSEIVGDTEAKEVAEKSWEIALLKSQLVDAERRIQELSRSAHSDEKDQPSSSLLCLRRIDFELKPGELIAVVGGVGCGKSSFVNSILGEVRQLTGTTNVKGELAYFSQTPFILNATLKDNILFGHVGEPVDEQRYQHVLHSCALTHDLTLLPDGDQTEIGEKGITLSGGQKARVALARAVYHQADITLIDDALSAVDAHVAKELFEEAIAKDLLAPKSSAEGGKGSKRSVILVTNALQYLNNPRVDKIVVIQEGRIVEEGTYKELSSKTGSVFARFLQVMSDTGVSGSLVEGCDVPMDESEGGGPRLRRRSTEEPVSTEKKPQKLMTEESRHMGHVDAKVYMSWINAAGGMWVPILILVFFTLVEGIQVLSNWWITYWSTHANSENQGEFLLIYAIINLSAAFASFLRMLLTIVVGLKAARKLFADLLAVVLHAPMAFFDTTPVGRLINRFSKDIYTVDEQLLMTLRTYLQTLFQVISTIVVISGVTPIFTLCLIPIVAFYGMQQAYFTITYRELKRLDSVNRSPIYALLGETVDGTSVIRAFSAQDSLVRRLTTMLDKQQHAYFLTCTAQSWLAVRLELVGTLIVTFAALSATIEKHFAGASESFAALAGLAVSYSLSVTQSLNWSVRMASDLEANMVAVERIHDYTQIESEGERHTPADKNLPPSWPTGGEIEFRHAKLRYRPGLPLVLKGLDIHVPAGSKVGVVGRTGAGKSTLMISLMRIVELSEGSILIDGQDIRTLGLATLRGNLAVIPQDPVLFGGSVRMNLDPFSEFSDEQLYGTLSRVGLYTKTSTESSSEGLLPAGETRISSLADNVTEGGSNFSVGQRQLLVIARALLRGARIVVMDEATAAVDTETDAAIQKVMRTEFAGATCLTIAHRLNTIMDSDYILVMDRGRAAEFDSPSTLLQKGGMFRDLVKAASQD